MGKGQIPKPGYMYDNGGNRNSRITKKQIKERQDHTVIIGGKDFHAPKCVRENKIAKAKVAEDQLSKAIGKDGQNARLAAKLTGWRIEVEGEEGEVKEEKEKKEKKVKKEEKEEKEEPKEEKKTEKVEEKIVEEKKESAQK